ncbi:hypothetical protein DVH24_029921 [Malus domestica]|uniref:Protein kinase domain-containing protein n=1 Tax=Malus domestica TaxID=3750 RepID=A0A498HWL4_MALDO|nr:hypothetical protein DVH24_029921 [Malus domestica]
MLIFMKSKRHHDFSVFSYSSILAATSNFAEENKLGQGGFGPVYKEGMHQLELADGFWHLSRYLRSFRV